MVKSHTVLDHFVDPRKHPIGAVYGASDHPEARSRQGVACIRNEVASPQQARYFASFD